MARLFGWLLWSALLRYAYVYRGLILAGTDAEAFFFVHVSIESVCDDIVFASVYFFRRVTFQKTSWNMFGGLIPGFIYDFASRIFMSESDPRYYDISFTASSSYIHELSTPKLNINYFFTEAALTEINRLREEKIDKFN